MRAIKPGSRVLVEVTLNRWAFGTVLRTRADDCEVAIDYERVKHWWTYDRVREHVEAPQARTLDHDFFAKKVA